MPRFSVCEISTLHSDLNEELRACATAGVEGIGICEFKLPVDGRDDAVLAALRTSGLSASICVPATLSILPLPLMPGSKHPQERTAALCAGLKRLAPFRPNACVCLTGPAGERPQTEARRIAVQGLREAARVAADLGLRLALEPVHPSIMHEWSLVCTLHETLELIEEVGEQNLGVLFDTWHLGDAPDVLQTTRRHAHRIYGVHVNDRRNPTRSWKDRVLPGEGTLDLPAILGALDAGGYSGWYDLEIFSDDGTFGEVYPDSLWRLPAVEIVRRGRDGFLKAWNQRTAAYL